MRRHAWIIVLLGVLAAGKASEPSATARGVFTLRIRSKFLEPGTVAGKKPLYLDRVSSERKGKLMARANAWYVPVKVEATRDLKSIQTSAFMHDPRLPEWDLWRHRHGYTLGMGRKYTWNSLNDRPVAMDLADAKFYDAYLIALYRHWIRQALKEQLGTGDKLSAPPTPQGETKVPLTLQYDETGLAEPVSGSFRIHAWHIPIDVGFTLLPNRATHPADWWFEVRKDAFFNYDKDAWRARHAYRKTKDGYQWEKDFPGAEALTVKDGERLDALLERGLAYWSDAALHIGLFELDQELKTASAAFQGKHRPSAR